MPRVSEARKKAVADAMADVLENYDWQVRPCDHPPAQYCANCGETLIHEAAFCHSCGRNLDDVQWYDQKIEPFVVELYEAYRAGVKAEKKHVKTTT